MARLIVVSGPGPVQGNDEPGERYVCLLCGYSGATYAVLSKHAKQAHPNRATRIEHRP